MLACAVVEQILGQGPSGRTAVLRARLCETTQIIAGVTVAWLRMCYNSQSLLLCVAVLRQNHFGPYIESSFCRGPQALGNAAGPEYVDATRTAGNIAFAIAYYR